METMSMSVAKALKELKLLKKRMTNAIRGDIWGDSHNSNKPNFITTQQADKVIYGKTSAAEFIKNSKEKFQSIKDMINRYKNIKKAVIQSNATTMVTIGNKTMTVAQAIEYKGSIEYEESFLNTILREYKNASEKVMDNNERVSNNADEHVVRIYGENKDRSKQTQDEMEKTRAWFVKEHEWKLVDPIGAEKVITDYRDKIDEFISNVDDIINTSNVRTLITIEQ